MGKLSPDAKPTQPNGTMKIKSIDDMIALKVARRNNCQQHKCQSTASQGRFCGCCRRLSQRLCRAYHKGNPEESIGASNKAAEDIAEEIVMRITYEFVFDFIDISTITSATWLLPSSRKCYGHTKRLYNIASALYRHRLENVVEWLQISRALHK